MSGHLSLSSALHFPLVPVLAPPHPPTIALLIFSGSDLQARGLVGVELGKLYKEREVSVIYHKQLAYAIMEAGKSKSYKLDWQARDSGELLFQFLSKGCLP